MRLKNEQKSFRGLCRLTVKKTNSLHLGRRWKINDSFLRGPDEKAFTERPAEVFLESTAEAKGGETFDND